MKQKFKFLEHTADVKFQAYGKTIEEAFVNSANALREVITHEAKIKPKISKTINVKGKDNEQLLLNFLEEFLFLLDAEDFIISKVDNLIIKGFTGDGAGEQLELTSKISGDRASNYKFSNSVKAITYNEMFVKQKEKFICQVVLDV